MNAPVPSNPNIPHDPGTELKSGRFERLLLKGTAVILGATALVGCSPDSAQKSQETNPADSLPTVAVDAYNPEDIPYGVLINTREITNAINTTSDAATRYSVIGNINPATQQDSADLPTDPSASVLTITLGSDKKLHYRNALPAISNSERGLLTAVEANAPLLTEAMSSDRINNVYFRIFKPTPVEDDPTYQPQDDMLLLAHDFNGGDDKPNLYYYLSADNTINYETLSGMLEHEILHGALDHKPEKVLSPEQYERYQDACGVLRNYALNEMSSLSGSTTDALEQLRAEAPNALKPAYTTVIDAIRDGSYGDLPTRELEPSEEPMCYTQTPSQALGAQARELGVDDLLRAQIDSNMEASDLLARASDDWKNSIEQQTIYQYLREATWLPPGPGTDMHGHPEEGMHEITVSSLNRLFKDAENFGRDMAGQPDDVSTAVGEILDLGIQQLQERYPDADDLHQVISQRRTAFNAQLGR